MHPVPAGVADDIGTAVFNRLSVASDRRRSLVVPRTRECTVLSTVMSCYSFADSKVRSIAMAKLPDRCFPAHSELDISAGDVGPFAGFKRCVGQIAYLFG